MQGHDASAFVLHEHLYYNTWHQFLKNWAPDFTDHEIGQAPIAIFHFNVSLCEPFTGENENKQTNQQAIPFHQATARSASTASSWQHRCAADTLT